MSRMSREGDRGTKTKRPGWVLVRTNKPQGGCLFIYSGAFALVLGMEYAVSSQALRVNCMVD